MADKAAKDRASEAIFRNLKRLSTVISVGDAFISGTDNVISTLVRQPTSRRHFVGPAPTAAAIRKSPKNCCLTTPESTADPFQNGPKRSQ
jgi:hypothetical protein